MSCQSDIMISA